jgi:hypothetical protein
MIVCRMRLLVLLCLAAWCAYAQPVLLPAAASTRLYFAQLADGGPPAQRWTTTLVLVNPNTLTAATVTVSFYGDNGQPLALDFGQGAKTTFQMSIPAGGAASYTSTGASSSTQFVIGWALAVSDVPVTGTVIYRASVNGAPQLDVAAAGSGSTYYFNSYANANLGIALANPSSTQSINVLLTARDQRGASAGTATITLAARAHTAFNLGPKLGSLPSGFSGSVMIASADTTPAPFVAWALNARDDLLGPLPAGEMQGPPPYDRRIYDIFARLKALAPVITEELRSAPSTFISVSPEQITAAVAQLSLVVDAGATMNIYFQQADKTIHITQAMVEAMGASDSALAFLLMRTMYLAVHSITGGNFDIGTGNIETSAQFVSVFMLFKVGYDPGGAMDCLGRLWYARSMGVPMDPSLVITMGVPTTISQSMQFLATYMPEMCSQSAAFAKDCQGAHNLWHPHFPSQVP